MSQLGLTLSKSASQQRQLYRSSEIQIKKKKKQQNTISHE
jgi:hypothetical protein